MTRGKAVAKVDGTVVPKAPRRRQLRGAASPLSPQQVAAEDRQRRAWELRLAGATFLAIARELGIDGQNPEARARELVVAYRTRVRSIDLGAVTEERELMAARLDRMLLDLWQARARRVADGVEPGTTTPRYRTEVDGLVIDRIIRVMDRQAKLLGLDAADVRDDRRLELLAEQAEAIARALDAALLELGISEELRERGRVVLAASLRVIEGESVRLGDRAS